MDRFCHLNLTKKWALEEGFTLSQSEEISSFCWSFDRLWWAKPWGHFFLCGASFASFIFLVLAKIFQSEKFLGYAIHAKQDAIGHKLIMPWNHRKYFPDIDSWQRADALKKECLEESTRQILKRASMIKERKLVSRKSELSDKIKKE